jgi:RNA polymerase sigma factor (sigma-70 family)
MSEAEHMLLRRFIEEGDASAFTEIVRRHAGLVYGACLRVLQDSDKAADTAQETFILLLRNAGGITGSIPSWLHRVATRRSIDLIRRDSVRRKREGEYNVDRAERAEPVTDWQGLSDYVDKELDKLDEQTRDILIRYFFEGQTTREIGSEVGVSQATISRRIDSGISRLRAGLRRRGIIVVTAVLGTLLAENAAKAAPTILMKELGKMAIIGSEAVTAYGADTAGAGATATMGGLLGTLQAKIITAVVLVSIGAGSVATYKYATHPEEPNPTTGQSMFDTENYSGSDLPRPAAADSTIETNEERWWEWQQTQSSLSDPNDMNQLPDY